MRNPGRFSAVEAYRLGWALVSPVVLLNYIFLWLEDVFEVSGWAALAIQAAYLAIRRPEDAHGAGRESPSVATVKRRSGAVSILSLVDQSTEDPSRSMKYRESLRLSVQVAICTAGLAALPLGWIRELIAAGQNPQQIILKVVFVIAF
jgi:hypothetical protein